MTIEQQKNGNDVCVKISGRLDPTTAPDLEESLKGVLPEAETLTLDFADLEYISSAGLRVLLSTQKIMQKKGGMKVTSVSDTIMEIFEVTGFADILTIA
jgi:anti-sigma B factor antagonist